MSSDENSEPRVANYSSSVKFYSKKKKKLVSRKNNGKVSSTSSDELSDQDEKRAKEKSNNKSFFDSTSAQQSTTTTSTSRSVGTAENGASNSGGGDDSSQLVLIKYKQSPDDPYGHNSLRANQLQKRREIQSLLLFIFILFVTIITLSQILVMHSQTNSSNFQQVKLMQEELKLMDSSIDRMLKEEHVLPISVWVAIKQYNDNLRKFANFMSDYVTNSSETSSNSSSNKTSVNSMSPIDVQSVLFDFNLPNSDEETATRRIVDLSTIASSLLNQLKNCSKSSHAVLNDHNKNNNDHQHSKNLTSLVRTWSKSSQKAFTHLARHVERIARAQHNSTTATLNQVEFLNFSQFEPVLNRYLNLTGQLLQQAVELSTTSRENQRACVQTLFFSLYYYFNAKFSILFEMYISTRTNSQINSESSINSNQTELDVYKTLMDETVRSINHNYCVFNKSSSILDPTSSLSSAEFSQHELVNGISISSDNYWQSVIHNPIRNVNEYVKRYKESKNKYDPKKKLCDPVPPLLYGVHQVIEKRVNGSEHDHVDINDKNVFFGGIWSPPDCQARHKIAIIIPYRDRRDHLNTLLSYLHPILQRQQLDYRIFVAEQSGNGTFNKAIIMNAGFIYAFDQDNYNCYCFHDVDLVPEDDRNMYSCGRNPKHMSIGVDEMNYKLQYEELIGGVLILRTEHLLAANGYSNLYWGWGAEDDDLYYRLKGLNYKIERPPPKIGRYKMMKHEKRKPQLWSKRAKLLYSSVNRMTWDGISSAKYTLLNVTVHKAYTHLLIDVGKPPPGFQ